MKAVGTPVVEWIERSIGSGARVVRIGPMPASATAKHLVEVALGDGSTQKLVLRCYHDAERLAKDPWYVPAREARVLQLLAETAVPAPRLYGADLKASVCDVPALLESWIPGGQAWRPDDVDRYLTGAAEVLAAIHHVSVPPDAGLPRYAPYYGLERVVSPPFSTRPGLWERVKDVLDNPWPAHRESFIHRDYHPGNVLWDGRQVTGVVDWAARLRCRWRRSCGAASILGSTGRGGLGAGPHVAHGARRRRLGAVRGLCGERAGRVAGESLRLGL